MGINGRKKTQKEKSGKKAFALFPAIVRLQNWAKGYFFFRMGMPVFAVSITL
jgi:hypothetical protein